MITALDDDDTIPTANADVLAEIAEAIADLRVSVRAWSAASSAGHRRSDNEDAWGQLGNSFVIADGMGGRRGGGPAALMAVERMLRSIDAQSGQTLTMAAWQDMSRRLNDEVTAAGRQLGFEHVGTTLLGASVSGPLVTLVHIGDSRAYRLRAADNAPEGRRRLDLLTVDHNVVSELLAAGLDVADYRDRGVALHGLTSFIGIETEALRVDVLGVPVRAGDRLLLCTDGVHRQLEPGSLRSTLATAPIADVAARLVDAADVAGGRDNATAIVVEFGALDDG